MLTSKRMSGAASWPARSCVCRSSPDKCSAWVSRDAGIFCLRDAPDGALRAGAAELFSAMVFSMAASGAASIRGLLLIGTRPLDICAYVGPTGIGCDGSRELDAEARLREVGLALSGLESYSDGWDGLGNEEDAAAAIGLDRPD